MLSLIHIFKAALAKMGYGTDTLRLPLTPMEEGRRAVLLNALKAWGCLLYTSRCV